MEEETRYTKQDLETMRAWTLQRKIQVTQTRLIEWLGRYDWNVYVSFSGGKDSTVLADLAARVYQVFSCPKRQDPLRLVFVNTGLEYPEIQKFVRDFAEWLKAKYKIPVELEILHPSMTFSAGSFKIWLPCHFQRNGKSHILRPPWFTMGDKSAGRSGQARE